MSPEGPTAQPLVLFDGVCNLCNAAVRWVIERDRRGVFRFGSLQSTAGRAALAAAGRAGPLLETMVLIDAAGSHIRSDAAIRIARGLGFPWSLASLAFLLPRPLRDAVYAWVARNRYQWFGRRESCMVPTPELAARFLDPAEPPEPEPGIGDAAPEASPAPSESVGFLKGFVKRFVLGYLFLLTFPFPVGYIPGTDWLGNPLTAGTRAAVVWVARTVFGIEITIFPGGSGDTTYNYVELFFYVCLALAGALAGSLIARGRPVSARVDFLMRTYVRYCLAAVLLSYGWSKVVPVQFGRIGPDSMVVSYGDLSPMGLLWRFMATSIAYQVFSGLSEVLAGALLLFRRTMLPGAFLAVVVLTNIAMLNFCFDVPVKIYSTNLLLMGLFLIAPDAMRLLGVSVLNLPVQPALRHPFPIRRTWIRRLLSVAGVAFIFLIAVYPVFGELAYYREQSRAMAASPLHGGWGVEAFAADSVSGRALPDDVRWVRVGINAARGRIEVRLADGSRATFWFKLDEATNLLTLTRRGDECKAALQMKRPEAGTVQLEGDLFGQSSRILLRRRPDDGDLLTSRGFHWINEFPFNR